MHVIEITHEGKTEGGNSAAISRPREGDTNSLTPTKWSQRGRASPSGGFTIHSYFNVKNHSLARTHLIDVYELPVIDVPGEALHALTAAVQDVLFRRGHDVFFQRRRQDEVG